MRAFPCGLRPCNFFDIVSLFWDSLHTEGKALGYGIAKVLLLGEIKGSALYMVKVRMDRRNDAFFATGDKTS